MKKDVEQILRERRLQAEEERDQNVRKAHEKFSNLKKLDERMDELSWQLLRATARKSDLQTIQAQLQATQRERDAELERAHLSKELYQPQYHCKICNDKGTVGQQPCKCREEILRGIAYQESNVMLQLDRENFSKFDLKIFREGRQPQEPMSPRENMKEIREQMENEYVKYFSTKSPNLYFFGPTGTGKSFLTNCIVKGVLDRGYDVLYQTATELIDFLISYSFMYSQEKERNRAKRDFIYDCDLLVIDDLGTEFINEKSKSTLFELINQRQLQRKPVMISSNLQPQELTDAYDARTASRIKGNYLVFEFYGNDLRQRP